MHAHCIPVHADIHTHMHICRYNPTFMHASMHPSVHPCMYVYRGNDTHTWMDSATLITLAKKSSAKRRPGVPTTRCCPSRSLSLAQCSRKRYQNPSYQYTRVCIHIYLYGYTCIIYLDIYGGCQNYGPFLGP